MAVRLLARLLAFLGDDLRAQVRGWRRGGLEQVARAWAARPPRRRLAAQALALSLLLLGLASLDARGRLSDRLPAARDWQALTALLERDARPGDLVAIVPPWLERAREAVPARLPLLATSTLDAEWLPGVRRVWLVAAGGVTSFGRSLPLAARTATADAQQVGQLRVTRLDLASPVNMLYALSDQPGAPTRWREVQGVARRCLELAARPGEPARLGWPRLKLGGALAGHAALLGGPADGQARLRVRLGEELPASIDLAARGGWLPFRVDTTRFAGRTYALALEADLPVGATLCLEAVVLP
jgi:hypothetical protein